MLPDPHLPPWPGDDDKIVVEEMLRDNLSEHWYECREFVRKQIFKKVSSNALLDRNDVVQVVMWRVYGGLADFHFGSRLTTWLMSIITNCMIDAYRKLKRMELASISSVCLGEPHESSEQEEAITPASVLDVEETCIS